MLSASVRGNGQTVVLLHSTGLSSRQFGALTRVLESAYRVVAVDLLGYGASPPFDDSRPFTIADEVESVVALLPDEPVHLVGHSYGGFLALQIALHHGERVRSLGVYDPVAFGTLYAPDDAEGLASLASIQDPNFATEATGGNEQWLRSFVDFWNRGPTWDALPQRSRDAFLQVGRKAFREVMHVMRDRTSARAYSLIQAPTLVLIGEQSPAAARRVGVRLASSMPHAVLSVMPGLGHMAPITDNAAINSAFAEHIRAHT
jgi:pimeloyl-ACP methyl ester carboxylesterase